MDCRINKNYNKSRCKKLRLIRGIPKKDLKWREAKIKYPRLAPLGNADGDKKKNKKDCRPFNKKKHSDGSYYDDVDLVVSPRVYRAFQDLRRGVSPNKLESLGYSNMEINSAFDVLDDSRRGKRIDTYYS